MNLQFFIHYGIHILVPLIFLLTQKNSNHSTIRVNGRMTLGYVNFGNLGIFLKTYFLYLLISFSIDLDHLFANPIFDPERCSIGFHFLHSELAIILYILFLLHRKTRWIGVLLLIHIFADFIDCLLM